VIRWIGPPGETIGDRDEVGAQKKRPNSQCWSCSLPGCCGPRFAGGSPIAGHVHYDWGKMRNDYSFAYSTLACLRTGMSRSASFQSVRKSW
jgi:hypothetical protein